MGKHGELRRTGVVMLVWLLVSALTTIPVAAEVTAGADAIDHQDAVRLEAAQRGMQQVRASLEEAHDDAALAQARLDDAELLLAKMEAIVNDIAAAVDRQERTVRTASHDLARIDAQHRALSAAMARQAVEIYKRGAAFRVDVMLRSGGASAAAARGSYLRIVTDVGRVTLETLEASELALRAEQQRYDGERSRLDRLMDAQREVIAEAETLRSHRLMEAAAARDRAAELEQKLDDLAQEEAEMLALIRQRQQEARLRDQVIRQASAQGLPADEVADELARIWPVSDAGYTWPMCLPVTSEYGPRWGRMHRGLDQPASPGERVHVVRDGVVLFADWYGAFGRLVLVEHDDGVVSAYAHLSRFAVQEGQRVARGTTIGAVGSTGRSTGPHLHLEFRVNGEAVDPRRLLPARKC